MIDKEIKQREAQMAQLMVLQARVTYHQTRILSGMYKNREVRIGGSEGRFLTEDELLNDEIAIMKRHIQVMQDIQEDLIPSENEV